MTESAINIDSQWTSTCASDDVQEQESWPVAAGGLAICLYRIEGQVYATDDRCSHGNAKLSDGFVEGHEIECPYHQGRFDIRTGQATLLPCTEPVKTYAAGERDGVVWLKLC